jgi:hypothetical protein
MSPRHFANYQNPNIGRDLHASNHNGFTLFAHKIGLGRFFEFVPGVFHYPPGKKAGDITNPDQKPL